MGTLFNPRGRITSLQFWSGFLILVIVGGVLALTQRNAPEGFALYMLAALVAKYSLFCVFAQRFRARGNGAAWALAPVGLSIFAAVIAWFAVSSVRAVPVFIEVANERGHDVEDLIGLDAAFRDDPGIQDAARERLENPDFAASVVSAAATPCYVALWATAALFGMWAGARGRAEGVTV